MILKFELIESETQLTLNQKQILKGNFKINSDDLTYYLPASWSDFLSKEEAKELLRENKINVNYLNKVGELELN